MSTAQWLYVSLISVYMILFLVFARIFYWKYQADRTYYSRRPTDLSTGGIHALAEAHNREVPGISLLVPARNEADVIEKTIDHLAHLNYSPEHYEILVVTDEKEAMASREERARVIANLTTFLSNEGPFTGGESEESVLLALLARLALEETDLAERRLANQFSLDEVRSLSPLHRQTLLHEMAQTLIQTEGKVDRDRLMAITRRVKPNISTDEADRLYPIFLSFAFPTVLLHLNLKHQAGETLIKRLMSQVAQARRPLTQKVLATLTETVSQHMTRRLRQASAEQLDEWLNAACQLALPTTQEIVERKRMEFAAQRGLPALKHVEVPYDFDGYVDGGCTGQWVPSTKGRALNWAFRFTNPANEMWGFYDAESRPEPDALLYVAWRRLTDGTNFRIAQGPVYQVRNFWKLGAFTKVAGIYQAISHEWRLPLLLGEIPFTGGTNMWVERNLMLEIGGFDDTVLTEDMELGARAWLKGGAWPAFIPCSSSEQTPASYKAFFRQRLRWGSGYLQVFDKLKADQTLPAEKKAYLLRTYWWKGHFSWTLFQLTAFLPLIAGILRWQGMLDVHAVPAWINGILFTFTPIYLLFTFYSFFHHGKHMDPAPAITRAAGFAQLFLLPISAFLLPVPYSYALALKAMGRAPKAWVKTPRTKE